MRHIGRGFALAGVMVFFAAAMAQGQSSAPATHRTWVIKMVTLNGNGGDEAFAFQPAVDTVQRGDTVEFVEAADVLHNIRFTSHARGAKLGSATLSPYLSHTGQKYDVVIDARFTDGTYNFVCDPHATGGMKGTLVVIEPATAGTH